MVHTRMSALGWVVGGSGTVVRALLEALGPDGTLVAYASWEDHVYSPDDWPAAHRAAYVAYLLARLAASAAFVEEAERARARPGQR